MTPVLYFLHLKTLDILLLIGNISVADDGFSKIYVSHYVSHLSHYKCNSKIKFDMNIFIFNSFLLFLS